MFINGQWVDAIDGGTFAVTNPATGDVIGSVPDGGAADATAAIDAAHAPSPTGGPPPPTAGPTC